MEIDVPADNANPTEVRKAESTALKYASEAAKKTAVEVLITHYQETGLTEIPSGEKIVKSSVYDISKL